MPVTGYTSYRLFGGASDQSGRESGDATNQRVPETVSATTSRKMRGPKANGHFAVMMRVTSAFGASSLATVWYSILPDPDETSDADWVQDSNITAVDLTATGNTLLNVGNVNAEWVRLKVVRATSDGALWAYGRVEGDDNR